MSDIIDLRSDTVTKPTPGMYQAMVTAELGDDMIGEDPTVNHLEATIAALLGKEAALLCLSGTQSNQVGLRCHCAPGDELLIHETGHVANFEAGAPAAISGITCRMLPGERGFLSVETLESAWRPATQNFPRTRLLCLENTTNMGGGAAWRLAEFQEVCGWAREKGLRVHLDGARIFNAQIAQGYSARELVAAVDTVSICFSKGLGCPFGSVLVGDREAITHARRSRKLMGGALRQAGVIAAAALYALEHHIERLSEDHANAQYFAEQIASLPGIHLDLNHVETNIVFFEVDPAWGTAQEFVAAALAAGVRMGAVHRQRVRAVTHLDVTKAEISRAAASIATVVTARSA